MTLDDVLHNYTAGTVDRAQLIETLTRWDYAPRATTTGELDDLIVDPPGSFGDVEHALRKGLIDDALFDEVSDRIEEQQQ